MSARDLAHWGFAFLFTQIVEVPIYMRGLRVSPLKAFGASALTHPVVWLIIPSVWAALNRWAACLDARRRAPRGLSRRFGLVAIFIQLLPFVMAHFGKSEREVYASIPGGLFLGWIAWRGETFLGAWLLHWLIATTMNLCFLFWPIASP